MIKSANPKLRIFNYKKVNNKAFANIDPLISPSKNSFQLTHHKPKKTFTHSLNINIANFSPINNTMKNKKSNHHNSNLKLSKKTISTKTTSQFLNFKSSKPIMHNKNGCSMTVLKNTGLLLNTLNLSSKNGFNMSIETSEPDLENKIKILQKEKEELTNKNKEQKKLISKLMNDNEEIEKNISQLNNYNKHLKDKIEQLKENQNQLVLLLKIIEKNGIDIEGIIDKWNEEVEKENEESEEKDSISNFNNIEQSDSRLESALYVPITIDEGDKAENKINYKKNIPKLNFALLKRKADTNNDNKIKKDSSSKTKEHKRNHSFSIENTMKKKVKAKNIKQIEITND